ncbi:MAG TPA: RNA-binding cell elongation regulator Jag/EloR [Armatimonadota bacterium]|jgi:spoIIIJ-associated protein
MTETETQDGPAVNAGETAVNIAQKLLDTGHLDAKAILVSQDEDSVELVLEGPDAPALIGKQGATLNALQYLVGLMLAREIHQRLRVTVDAESYRARRAETLIKMAKDLAAQVREHNQEAVMDPLNAAERRIVHTALVEEPGISTYSEGEDPDRRVVISPKA